MKTIFSIQHMRGIAALFVVFFHTRWMLNNVYAQKDLGDLLFFEGYFGVDLFFMISGFIITYSTQSKESNDTLSFFNKRFFRIYPLFFICLTVGALLVPHYANFTYAELIKSYLLIPFDFKQSAPGFGYNILLVAWTLAYEIAFYLVFMIAMHLSHKHRSLVCSVFLLITTIAIQLHFNGSLSAAGEMRLETPSNTWCYSLAKFASNPMLWNFIVGMIVAEIFMSRIAIDTSVATLMMWVATGFFCYAYFSHFFHGKGLAGMGLPCAVIFSAYALYDKTTSVNKNNILSFLGDISYSLYLSHLLVIQILHKYQISMQWEWYSKTSGMGRIAIYLTITLLVSYILHVCIEKPSVKLGRKLSLKKTNKIKAAQ